MSDDYVEKAARAAKIMKQKEAQKTDGEKRLEKARLTQLRFDYLDGIQQGQTDTRRRYADERYVG